MSTALPADDDEIPAEVDFLGGTRDQFHRPGVTLNLPVYLDADVQIYLAAIAARKGISLSDVANDLLKREIEIIETVKG